MSLAKNLCKLLYVLVIGKQRVNQSNEKFPYLDLRDFFDAYDRTDPHMLAAVSSLYSQILEHAPHLLQKDADWYQDCWIWGGKRDLRTGLKLKKAK